MLKQAFLAAAISTTLLAGCATTPTHTAHAPMHAANIVDVAKSNPDFSILEIGRASCRERVYVLV